jgi:hypothetical protein
MSPRLNSRLGHCSICYGRNAHLHPSDDDGSTTAAAADRANGSSSDGYRF